MYEHFRKFKLPESRHTISQSPTLKQKKYSTPCDTQIRVEPSLSHSSKNEWHISQWELRVGRVRTCLSQVISLLLSQVEQICWVKSRLDSPLAKKNPDPQSVTSVQLFSVFKTPCQKINNEFGKCFFLCYSCSKNPCWKPVIIQI